MKLPEAIVGSIARCATDEIMERLEQHVEAHPFRYRGVSDEAYELLRRRIEHTQLALLREIEIPPLELRNQSNNQTGGES